MRLQTSHEVVGKALHSVSSAQHSAQHSSSCYVLSSRVAVGQQRLLWTVGILVGEVEHGGEGAVKVAGSHRVLPAPLNHALHVHTDRLARLREGLPEVSPVHQGHEQRGSHLRVLLERLRPPEQRRALHGFPLGRLLPFQHGMIDDRREVDQPVERVRVVPVVVRAVLGLLSLDEVGKEHAVAGTSVRVVVSVGSCHEVDIARVDFVDVEGALGGDDLGDEPSNDTLQGVFSSLHTPVVEPVASSLPVLLLPLEDHVADDATGEPSPSSSSRVG
mmetsp:Transcript_33603/g.105836  ORF Transcript_33603/g.105836 Transcript_33603/m.105836 type:complete len:274 (-) Transcript_33603:455-1276(-)